MSEPGYNDHQQLQLLVTEYANALDNKDWDRLDQVFTPDAYVDYSAMGGIRGHYPEIKAWLPNALGIFRNNMHFVGNFQFHIDGDNATGQVACMNPLVLPSLIPKLPRTVVLGLWYHDEYQRTDDGWRISRRNEQKCFALNEPLWMKIGTWIYQRVQSSGK